MTDILDTRTVPAADRAEVVRETVAASKVRVEIDFPAEAGPAATYGAFTQLGQLLVCSIRSNALTAERTPALARDELEPSIFLGLQLAGTSLIVQGGREAVLKPRDLVVYESTEPYTLVDADGIRQHFFRIPIAAVGLPRDAIRQVCATTLSPGHPIADLVAAYLYRLASRPDLYTHPDAGAVSRPTVGLVRALITTHLDATALGKEPLHATLRFRILEYVRARLGDPGLNAGQIAAEHHISVRHLYNVLAAGGISLGDWIRDQRLEGSREDLTRPELRSLTIATVARRWGFTDPSSFGRVFRAAYGLSPREWRALAHRDR
ncbi:helix-turn-helix domain-containing protein [Kribbella jejuensis]|uniref:AraC-like DNA-binding protein n=1 Tax=Kribbella jejuensis TaxID=236068 RepID=A0A542DSF6_9ACTN|nr:helix-turn-helix domain-containing protein [Kribbella jejuensis]TQJ06018.1 AraC-like DNA-binding protein [Kribbella jejuensis]